MQTDGNIPYSGPPSRGLSRKFIAPAPPSLNPTPSDRELSEVSAPVSGSTKRLPPAEVSQFLLPLSPRDSATDLARRIQGVRQRIGYGDGFRDELKSFAPELLISLEGNLRIALQNVFVAQDYLRAGPLARRFLEVSFETMGEPTPLWRRLILNSRLATNLTRFELSLVLKGQHPSPAPTLAEELRNISLGMRQLMGASRGELPPHLFRLLTDSFRFISYLSSSVESPLKDDSNPESVRKVSTNQLLWMCKALEITDPLYAGKFEEHSDREREDKDNFSAFVGLLRRVDPDIRSQQEGRGEELLQFEDLPETLSTHDLMPESVLASASDYMKTHAAKLPGELKREMQKALALWGTSLFWREIEYCIAKGYEDPGFAQAEEYASKLWRSRWESIALPEADEIAAEISRRLVDERDAKTFARLRSSIPEGMREMVVLYDPVHREDAKRRRKDFERGRRSEGIESHKQTYVKQILEQGALEQLSLTPSEAAMLAGGKIPSRGKKPIFTIDHKVDLNFGGMNTPENFIAVAASINERKNKLLQAQLKGFEAADAPHWLVTWVPRDNGQTTLLNDEARRA